MRVSVVTNILPPYRRSLYARLTRGGAVIAWLNLLASNEPNRDWAAHADVENLAVSVLPGGGVYVWRWEIPIHVNRGVGAALGRQKPEVVMITGWDQPAYWQAAWWCRRNRIPFVLHSGSTMTSGLRRGAFLTMLRRLIVKNASTYVAYGSQAHDYLLKLGADPARVHIGLNTVDVDGLANSVEIERTRSGTRLRRSTYPSLLLLYVGQLVRRKRVDLILHALATIGNEDVGLLIVGSGPEERRLRDLVAELRLRHVHFEGFRQQSALPSYYAMADAMIVPSDREVWGLVVNEALASGLFVVASDRVGAVKDAVREDWNGRTFRSGDAGSLAAELERVFLDRAVITRRRDAIARDAQDRLGIDQLATAVVEALHHAIRATENDSRF